MAATFGFNSASLSLIILPLALLLLLQIITTGGRGRVSITGLEYLRTRQSLGGGGRRVSRLLLWGVLVLMLGVLWSGPVLYTGEPLLQGAAQIQRKNILVAIDISASMAGPLKRPDREARFAAFGRGRPMAGDAGAGQQTRYQAARQTLNDFIERFRDARIGLILFSTEPFLARWPTTETGTRFQEVMHEELGQGEASQLQRFSSLTNTNKALELARDVFRRQQGVGGGAVIHISDAEDDLENMGNAIRELRQEGIRLYTIGVGISETIVQQLSRDFGDDPGFRIFRADSAEEMREAYRLVSALEESPRFDNRERQFITELRGLLAIVLVLLAALIFVLLETVFHQSPIGHKGR